MESIKTYDQVIWINSGNSLFCRGSTISKSLPIFFFYQWSKNFWYFFRCVRRYEGHLNRSFPCGVDLSPCGKYVVTGAEDRCVSRDLKYILKNMYQYNKSHLLYVWWQLIWLKSFNNSIIRWLLNCPCSCKATQWINL